MFKKKYIAVSLLKENESYSVLKIIRFNPLNPIIKGKRIDTKNPTFSKGLKTFFYLDNKGNQLSFNSIEISNMDTKIIDDILSKKVISELTKDMSGSDFRKKIIDMLTGGLIGGLISFIISAFLFGGIVV